MRSRLALAGLSVALVGMGCPAPRTGGEDAAVVKAPADQIFSVGVTQKTGGAPQTASPVKLKFRGGTRSSDTVVAERVSKPLTVDGEAADWASVPESKLAMVGPGAAIGMTKADWDSEWLAATGLPSAFDHGVSEISVKAAFDDTNLYFLLVWADADETANHNWAFQPDAGVFWRNPEDLEDRASLAFNINKSFPGFEQVGCIAACHVKERMGAFDAGDVAYRFQMHTSGPSELGDLWSWKLTHTSPVDLAHDQHWSNVTRVADPQADGGRAVDFGLFNMNCLCGCRAVCPDGGVNQPKSMGEGGVNSNPPAIYLDSAGRTPRGVLFDRAGAAAGARIPGHYFQKGSPEISDVKAVGKWANGKWTVEFSRALVTGDPKDAQFPLE